MDGGESTFDVVGRMRSTSTLLTFPVVHKVDSGVAYKLKRIDYDKEGPPAVGYHTYLGWCSSQVEHECRNLWNIGDLQPTMWVS